MKTAICAKCGQAHGDLAFSIPTRLPTEAARVPVEERERRVWTNDELCVLDDAHFFLYGSIPLPIQGHDESFLWGAWAEISETDFFSYQEMLHVEDRQAQPLVCGVVATDIPFYPATLGLSLHAHVQPRGLRPLFELADVPHPLAVDSRGGVTPLRIREISKWFDDLKAGRAA